MKLWEDFIYFQDLDKVFNDPGKAQLFDTSSVIRQKGESQNGCFNKTKHVKFYEKRTFLIRTAGTILPFLTDCTNLEDRWENAHNLT